MKIYSQDPLFLSAGESIESSGWVKPLEGWEGLHIQMDGFKIIGNLLEYADYHEERKRARKESFRLGKLFRKFFRGVFQLAVVIVTYFLKREAGKDRPLFQVGPEYDSLASLAALPYSKSIYAHPDICVGASGEKVFGDIAVRMYNFKRFNLDFFCAGPLRVSSFGSSFRFCHIQHVIFVPLVQRDCGSVRLGSSAERFRLET